MADRIYTSLRAAAAEQIANAIQRGMIPDAVTSGLRRSGLASLYGIEIDRGGRERRDRRLRH